MFDFRTEPFFSVAQTVRISDVLYEEVVEVQERVVLCRDDCKLNDEIRGKNEQKTTTTGEKVFE